MTNDYERYNFWHLEADQFMIEQEKKFNSKANHLLELYKNKEDAIKHAKNCLSHVDIDNEPVEMKEFWNKVIEILN